MQNVTQIISRIENSQDSKSSQQNYPIESTKTDIYSTNCQTTISSSIKTAIDGIWDIYARKFGNKFRSTIVGDDRDYMIWYSAIRGLSKSDIDRGKRQVLSWYSSDDYKWFPDEKEFRIMCMGITDSHINKLKQLTLRWSGLLKEQFKDTLIFRRAKWILKEMARDSVAHYYRNIANHKEADRLFNEYFNRVISISYDNLEPVSLMIEQKDTVSKENVTSILSDIKSFL